MFFAGRRLESGDDDDRNLQKFFSFTAVPYWDENSKIMESRSRLWNEVSARLLLLLVVN